MYSQSIKQFPTIFQKLIEMYNKNLLKHQIKHQIKLLLICVFCKKNTIKSNQSKKVIDLIQENMN